MAAGDIPESIYRNTLDLNRFSTGTARKLVRQYDQIINDAIDQLAIIERMRRSKQPKYKADRLRSLLKQLKTSLDGWSNKSAAEMVKDLNGIARIQSEFAELQLAKALPTGSNAVINPINVTKSYAEAVVKSKPIDLNASLLSDDLQAKVKGVPEKFSLTSKQGSLVNLPNGEPLLQNFRALAAKQAELFGRTVRDGMLTGETTPQIARQLRDQLIFEDGKQMRPNQVTTLVRTSVQQVSNDAAQSVYEANQDISSEYRWIATLDSKTAPQCRVLDQQVFKYGEGPTPPQHFNCRCRTVAVLDHKKLGISKELAERKLGKRSAEGGAVKAGTSYGKFLTEQSTSYKAKALGKTKVKYFNALSKKYGPDQALKKMIRTDGQSKTLTQLQKTYGKQPSKKLTTAVKTQPKPKLKPTKKETALLAAEKKKKAEVQSLKKQIDSLAKDSPSKEVTALKRTVDKIAGPQVATATKLDPSMQNLLQEFKKVDLKNPKHKTWFYNQKLFNAGLIPKGQFDSITPPQLARRIEDKAVVKLQAKFNKAYKKSLLPPKPKVKRAPLKAWDDPSLLNKKLKGESKSSATRKTSGLGKKTSKDLLYKPKPEQVGLTKPQFTRVEEIFDEWSGNDYKTFRGVQLQQAEAVGAQLNPGEITDLKRFKNRYKTTASKNVWARNADKMEDYIAKAPKWKGSPELDAVSKVVDPDGTIYRGMSFRDPKVVDSIVDAYGEGKATLSMESWSRAKRVAKNFAEPTSSSAHSVILKQVNKHGTSIEPWNGLAEGEILQPRGIRYKVANVEKTKWTEKIDNVDVGFSRTEITLEAY